ncbi:hypothetical protein [Pseudovibrio sp. SPO723]|uniref:hypothetical protein n=1 Tax=Nesiotobacter zosterae TaxID=392721 RepID=UPI0029C4217A|nr:hypothetical protein [Pseudovibrio sp. SPO723]MDX5592556.1 hypothetical protein [Pseudovibrio sp. SPO723]
MPTIAASPFQIGSAWVDLTAQAGLVSGEQYQITVNGAASMLWREQAAEPAADESGHIYRPFDTYVYLVPTGGEKLWVRASSPIGVQIAISGG